jgi:hypothetical protein
MNEIGQLGETPKNPTHEQVLKFFDNLKEQTLKYLKDGVQVHLEQQNDMEPIYHDSGPLADYRWHGCTWKIYIGRGASKRRFELFTKTCMEVKIDA